MPNRFTLNEILNVNFYFLNFISFSILTAGLEVCYELSYENGWEKHAQKIGRTKFS